MRIIYIMCLLLGILSATAFAKKGGSLEVKSSMASADSKYQEHERKASEGINKTRPRAGSLTVVAAVVPSSSLEGKKPTEGKKHVVRRGNPGADIKGGYKSPTYPPEREKYLASLAAKSKSKKKH